MSKALFRKFFRWLALFSIKSPIKWKIIRGLLTLIPVLLLACLGWKFVAEEGRTAQNILAENGQPMLLEDGRPMGTEADVGKESMWEEGQIVAKRFLQQHWILGLFVLASPVLVNLAAEVYEAWGKKVQKLDDGNLGSVMQTTLLRALNEIVAKKLDRFAKFARQVKSSGVTPGNAFCEITRPELQLEEIVGQIYNAVGTLLNKPTITVVLVECTDGAPANYIACKPHDARPDDLLLTGNSFFQFVANSDQPVAIPDLAAHLVKLKRKKPAKGLAYFLQIGARQVEGSMVGYAIKSTYLKEAMFVLTLKCSEDSVFTDTFVKEYRPLMDSFLKRIELEGCLLRIRNRSTVPHNHIETYANDNIQTN